MQTGGCIDDGRRREQPELLPAGTFTGANFQYLAANVVVRRRTGKTILPPYTIKNFNGAKVGFIGMTLKDTPTIVTAVRRRRPRVQRRGRDRQRARARCSRRRASRRSSC